MISLKQPIELRIPAPGGVKAVVINFPTDDQLDERQRKRSFSVKGTQETNHECPEFDAQLIAELKISGPDLEASECTWVLNKLSSSEITDGGRCEDGFFVAMDFLGNSARHELRIPSADQLQKYKRDQIKTTSTRYGGTTYTVNLRPGRALYDALMVKADGYPDGYVPITHKAAVVSELASLIDSEVAITNPTPSPAPKA